MEFEYPVNYQSVFVVGASQADNDNEEFGGFSGQVDIQVKGLTGRNGGLEIDPVLLCGLFESAVEYLQTLAAADVDGDGYSGPFLSTVTHYPGPLSEGGAFEGCES